MQGMSKDNTPIIPNPTKKVKPFCKKNLHGNFPAFCAALPVPVPAAAVICAWIPNIKGKDTVYVSLKNKFDNDFARKSIFKNMLI